MKKNYVSVTYSAPVSAKKSVVRVFKMSILDLSEARLSGVRACLSGVWACQRSPGKPKTLITLLFLSFERRENKSMS